ncbi:MAG TPA: zinc-binding dehydrogenase [Anaeromyxobacteraceae bacterium]|nr:zinc-binding dehydrogenase [Anaeromyxobacteraceae bacterium]
MRAIAVMKPDEVRVVEIAVPKPGPYQALVRTEAAIICNATDRKLVQGHFPGVDRYPLVLGHEGAGRVVAVGEKVHQFAVGDRAVGGLVFEFSDRAMSSGWGGFCEYTLVNDHDAMVADGVADEAHGWLECYEIQRKVDPDIGPAEAAMLCTWREVYGGLGDFHLRPGDDIIVFGAGPVGQSFVKLGRLFGLGWIGVVDRHPEKLERSRALGADAVFPPGSPDLLALSRRARKLDAVIDAIGSPQVMNLAMPLVKMGGSVCVYGVLSDKAFTLDKSSGPYNFNLFVHQWPTRWREREAQGPVCEFIRQGRLKASEFVTHELPMERFEEGLRLVSSGKALKCLLQY